ncbi:MAG: hypothetical protein NUV86_04710 [Candidatus Scalindua sp.]|nr:hypothetical protein [Candidatus Scalindua sp.]MCR4345022.1 hypothetical protein [Candidatus Scalindua sp.]
MILSISFIREHSRLQLNSSKTIASKNVVRDSLKPDKLYWISNKQYSKNLQKELFIIKLLSEKYPDSGVLSKSLMGFLLLMKKCGMDLTT